jgi:hypothetical protein
MRTSVMSASARLQPCMRCRAPAGHQWRWPGEDVRALLSASGEDEDEDEEDLAKVEEGEEEEEEETVSDCKGGA